jgi:hypothetical protein
MLLIVHKHVATELCGDMTMLEGNSTAPPPGRNSRFLSLPDKDNSTFANMAASGQAVGLQAGKPAGQQKQSDHAGVTLVRKAGQHAGQPHPRH